MNEIFFSKATSNSTMPILPNIFFEFTMNIFVNIINNCFGQINIYFLYIVSFFLLLLLQENVNSKMLSKCEHIRN